MLKANRGPTVALFDIRIGTNEKDVIVITPNDIESNPTLVRGKVVLSLSDSISVRSITLRLYGVASVAWIDRTASNRTPPTRCSQKQTKTIFDKQWSFLPQGQSTFTLQEGNYEYPFEVLLPDDIPESVEGLPGGAIIYKMKAVVERSGLVNKNITCRKHIRIARTMSPTSFEFLQSQCIENLWPAKCQYTIEIPTTAHIIGSRIPFHLHMIPHAKGLSICRLDVELRENYSFAVFDPKNALIAEKKMERSIKTITCDSRPQYEEDDWNVYGHLEVPNSLDQCTQDCDTDFIKVKHRIKFIVGLRNADRHISEIRASVPVALVLPPYVSSTGSTPHLDDSTVNHICKLRDVDVLPTYESRIYDRLWDGVSYPGLDTSALNTPMNMSRRTSAENLRDLNRLSIPNPEDLEAGLHRVMWEQNTGDPDHESSSENLPALATSSGIIRTHASLNPRPSTSSFQGMTPLNAEEEHPRLTPVSSSETQHISPSPSNSSHISLPYITRTSSDEYVNRSSLSRVPSYKTANSSILNLDPISNALPSYTAVVYDRPSSSSLNIPRTEPRSRAGSNASSRSQSPARRPLPNDSASSVPQMNTGVSNNGMGSVYGSAQNFDDRTRRLSLMRSIFSHH